MAAYAALRVAVHLDRANFAEAAAAFGRTCAVGLEAAAYAAGNSSWDRRGIAAAGREVGVENRRDSAAAYTRRFVGLPLTTTAAGRVEAAALPAAVVEGYLVHGQESSLLFIYDVYPTFSFINIIVIRRFLTELLPSILLLSTTSFS